MITLQQITDEYRKDFNKIFYVGIKNQPEYFKVIISHLISLIKKAVEMAFKEIEENERREYSFDNQFFPEARGFNEALFLIEKKKSLFLNK